MSPLVALQRAEDQRVFGFQRLPAKDRYVTGNIFEARLASFFLGPFLPRPWHHGLSYSSPPPLPHSLFPFHSHSTLDFFDSALLHRSNAAPQGTRAMSHSSSLSHTDSPSPSLPDEGYDEQRIDIPKWVQGWSDEQRAGTADDTLRTALKHLSFV